MQVSLAEGSDQLEVVGESFRQPNLWRVVGGRPVDRVRQEVYAILVAEHGNRHDANAVSVWVGGLKVGFVPRGQAALLRPGLIALQEKHSQPIALAGVIAGGGADDDGRVRQLGVFLEYDRADFGLAPTPPAPRANSGSIRTGLSEAVRTDSADDTYDLSWMNALSDDAANPVLSRGT